MASASNCGGGCCDSTVNRAISSVCEALSEPAIVVDSADDAQDSCEEGCCSDSDCEVESNINPVEQHPIQQIENAEPICSDGCCPGEVDKDSVQEACSPENDTIPEASCNETCCSLNKGKAKQRDADDSACCETKSASCCDASCVDRIAIRECEKDCGKNGHGPDTRATGAACAAHQNRTHEKYAAKIAALECICRALIALGQESCCIPKGQSSTRGKAKLKNRSHNESNSSDCCNDQQPRDLVGTIDDTCSKSKAQISGCATGCCKPASVSSNKPRARAKGNLHKSFDADNSISAIDSHGNPIDIEKGTFGNEHVVLSIAGMTCTGCETKLLRVLGALPQVSNPKVSLVLARAEFDLDLASMTIERVINHLERTTEFKCEQISTQGSNVEVIPINTKEFLDQTFPLGVDEILPAGKGVVRIKFDPKVIGVRALVQKSGKYSCQLAPMSVDPSLAAGSKHVRNMGYTTLLSIILTIPVLILAWAPIKARPILYGAVSLALATIIQIVVAGPFYPKALKSLIFSRMIEMDLLIVLSTSAAYIFSVVSFSYLASGRPLSIGEFFETSTLLVTLIMIGRWVAALSRQKAVESISIRALQSSKAQLVTGTGMVIEEIDTRLFQYGDLFSLLPEHRVPTDGIVISGNSEIDESMLTGESRLVGKHVGSKVIAGSMNGSGKLIVRLTRLPQENTISIIAGMVDNAKPSKPRIQYLADRVASYFVPVIILLTMITFIVWIIVGVAVQNKSGSDAAIQAITYAITVLIVSCPCAIGLAVPMVIVIGSGVAAERGVIFKSADSIEMAYKTTHVVFDKTGTLTLGKLKVLNEQYESEDTDTLRSMIFGLVVNSKHPISAAVANHYAAWDITPTEIDEVRTVIGKGIEGKVDAKVLRGGNASWLEVESNDRVQHFLSQGHTVFCVTLDSELLAIFGLSDTVRPEATTIIAKLKDEGVRVSLLSGDEPGAVQSIATQVGLDSSEAQSRCSSSDKQKYIQELLSQSNGKKRATVVFVGDGTNDAVALAQATIGVHMSSGTDVAQSAADVVLMRPSLDGVLAMMNASHAAVLRIKFNFAWSFIYNVLALLFASGALVSAHKGKEIRIPPQYAGLGELVSVLPVIAIAVGLKWVKL